MMELNKIYNMDCLEGMKMIEDDSINLVFTSPPYNMNLRVRNGEYCSRQITKEFSTKYEGFSDNLPMDDYFEFNKNIIEELLRVSNLVFYNVQFLTGNKRALFKIIGHFSDYLKEFIVWDKTTAQPAMQDKVLNSQFEVILVFDKNNSIVRQFKGGNFDRGTLSNLWRIKRGGKVFKNHGAVFPIELAEKLIKNFSKEGDTILDPFIGTGTTAIASYHNKRKYIGFELNEEYYKLATKRIEDETAQTNIFDFI